MYERFTGQFVTYDSPRHGGPVSNFSNIPRDIGVDDIASAALHDGKAARPFVLSLTLLTYSCRLFKAGWE